MVCRRKLKADPVSETVWSGVQMIWTGYCPGCHIQIQSSAIFILPDFPFFFKGGMRKKREFFRNFAFAGFFYPPPCEIL